MQKPNAYPTNFRAADDDGTVQFIEMTVAEARTLVDQIEDNTLAEGLDMAQGDASITGKAHYVILRVRGED